MQRLRTLVSKNPWRVVEWRSTVLFSSWVNTSSAAVRRNYEAWSRRAVDSTLSTLRRYRIDNVSIGTGEDYVKELIAFFKNRA